MGTIPKKLIKDNFSRAMTRLEYRIEKLKPVLNQDSIDDLQNVVDEYQHLIEVLREEE